MALDRQGRREELRKLIKTDPFLTDQQLADELGVSVATIRLDRTALGIPELRERIREMAARTHEELRSLRQSEIIGELIDIRMGESAISILTVTEDMVFAHTQILRGHYLFAQGNSLAVALVNADVVLTKNANVKFIRPVKLKDRVVAKATIVDSHKHRFTVIVNSHVQKEPVFQGEYVVVALNDREEDEDN